MTLETLRAMLGWCTLINFALLLWWAGWIMMAPDLVHRIHGRWFQLSREQFDTIHYVAMACFKLVVLVFNLVPYLALRIVG